MSELVADDTMWDIVLVMSSVLTYMLLYWSYRNKSEKETNQKPGDETTKSTSSIHLSPAEKLAQNESDGFERGRIGSWNKKKRIAFLKKRKELVEKDIIRSLGLSSDEAGFEAFCDKFNTFEVVSNSLVKIGFCACDVIIGIDLTASNEWQGKRTFNKTSLHKTIGSKTYNPYQKVISIIGKTLGFISAGHNIYAYGFGDETTKDHSVLPFSDGPVQSYQEVIEAYTQGIRHIKLSGPTNLAPLIKRAIELCKSSGQYHILIIILDGQISSKCEHDTIDAIVEASNYPLSIIAIGIGDGPFSAMFEYDDGLPKRKFDNFQFVNFHRTVMKSKHEAAFALHALMEIPDQYQAISQLGYLNNNSSQKPTEN